MRPKIIYEMLSSRLVTPAYDAGNIERLTMSNTASPPPKQATTPVVATLLPIMGVVLVAFLVIGLALPVIPLHVHEGLGLSTFMVGLVAGIQFFAALLSRLWAGHFADSRGPKRAVVTGLLIAAVSGLVYLVSLWFIHKPETSVAILLAGRGLLGAAESFIITGALLWGLALGGPQNVGRVMAWMGTALFAAFAVGAPAGTALYGSYGFAAIGIATALVPLCTLLLVAPLRPVAPIPASRPKFVKVAGSVWVPGLGLAFSSVGFGATTTFVVLVYAKHGWSPTWLPFTALSITFILGRVVFGHLPDKIGGARVALVCVLIEAAGQALVWLASSSSLALLGVALTGFGYSLVYPGFGVEAVRLSPPESRGLAMGAYTAFLDLALGLANPGLGLVAGHTGVSSVFLVSTLVVMCALIIAVLLVGVPTARR